MRKQRIHIVFGLLLWALGAVMAPATLGWRDSGEFLLTAAFLDIPHPAGFPLYSALSNLFSFIPFGHLAWRTHVFSAACSIALLYNTFRLTEEALPLLRLSRPVDKRLCWCAPFFLLLCEPFIHGSIIAEVYTLHALLIIGVLRCIARFLHSSDARWLYSAAFVGGLSLGNHVVGVLAGAWILAGLLLFRAIGWRQGIISACFVATGLLVYLYLPMRATANPPLNTGSPAGITRLFRQVTDARDRDLRPPTKDSHTGKPTPEIFLNDIKRLGTLASLPVSLLALAGFAWSFRRAALFTFCLLGPGITAILFFAGWDPDPWTIACAVLAITATLAVCGIQTALQSRLIPWAVATLSIVFAALKLPTIWTEVQDHKNFNEPVQTAQRIFAKVPRNGIVAVEASWFLTRYLQQLEGYRKDAVLLYLPGLLFPDHFNPASLSTPSHTFTAISGEDPKEPQFSNLASVAAFGTEERPVTLEITTLIAAPFQKILILSPSGTALTIKGQPGTFDPAYVTARALELHHIEENTRGHARDLRDDGINYIETALAHETGALRALGHLQAACDLITLACPDRACSAKIAAYREQVCLAAQNPPKTP